MTPRQQFLIVFVVLIVVICIIFALRANNAQTPPTSRYQGTAPAGDFVELIVDHSAQTVTYVNHANDQSGGVSYTVQDGMLVFDPTQQNLLRAIEIPGDALILQLNNGGSNGTTPTMVFAIRRTLIDLPALHGKTFNMMQLRLANSAAEIGACSTHADLSDPGLTYRGYSVLSGLEEAKEFQGPNEFPLLDPSLLAEDGASIGMDGDTAFATSAGSLFVDNSNGSILLTPQLSTPSLPASALRAYTALVYINTDANNDSNINGDILQTSATLTLAATDSGDEALVTLVIDGVGTVFENEPLVAARSREDIVGDGRVEDNMAGMFALSSTRSLTDVDAYFMLGDGGMLLFCCVVGSRATGATATLLQADKTTQPGSGHFSFAHGAAVPLL